MKTHHQKFSSSVCNRPNGRFCSAAMVGFARLGIYPETTNGRRFGGRFNTEEDSIALRDDEPVPAEQAQKEKAIRNGDAATETHPCVVSRRESLAERSVTSLTLYMREIGRVKLLTPREEIELAARIKKGDRQARDQMIKANLPLVVKIAQNYEGNGMPQIQNAAFFKLRCRIKKLELSLAPIKREFQPFVPDLNETSVSQQVL